VRLRLYRSPQTTCIREPGTGYPVRNTRMAGLVAFDWEVIGRLLHLWLFSLLHLRSIFITFMVGTTFMVFIIFMGDTTSLCN